MPERIMGCLCEQLPAAPELLPRWECPGGGVTGIALDPNDWQHAFVTSSSGIWETTDMARVGRRAPVTSITVRFENSAVRSRWGATMPCSSEGLAACFAC